MLPIVGYPSSWSVSPGQTIDFKVSSVHSEPYRVELRRIICGDPNPKGPGIQEEYASDIFSGEFPSRYQPVRLGSYGEAEIGQRLPALKRYVLSVRLWPTLISAGRQGLMTLCSSSGDSLSLQIDADGCLAARHVDAAGEQFELSIEEPLRERRWYTAALIVDTASGTIELLQFAHSAAFSAGALASRSLDRIRVARLSHYDRVYFAALSPDDGLYNGKLEQPEILDDSAGEFDPQILERAADTSNAVASWDFSIGIGTQQITDAGPMGLNGRLVNCPTRAVCGSNWTGEQMCWRHAPDQYGAIHFHHDDLYDCQWETDFSFTVPDRFPSAMYAMHIECGGDYDDIPFYVRPQSGKPQADICVIVPTFTYTVYINQSRKCTGQDYDRLVRDHNARPWNPDQHPQYGLSTYNDHDDGSGICYSSSLRPAITMRTKFIAVCESFVESGMRHLPADTHLLAWLEHFGFKYDVVCDHDLHDEGMPLLESYKAVLTMSHPEYHTRNTLDALESYIRNGGRLMYLGGNGFYWKVSVSPELPGMVEIRRAEGGIRTWAAEPGEYYNALDGGYGGMWRRNGRPPQQLVGVGFSGQGKFQGTYYRRNMKLDERFQWIFEGVDEQIIGDFGLSGGGAAGFELDRADWRLGTPENAVILASSGPCPDHFVLVPEERLTHLTTWSGESEESLIRADMVYFDTAGGGAVFSVGSISYCGSLPVNGFSNSISRITLNVLTRFVHS